MKKTHIRNTLGITILALAAAGCASDPMSAAAGGTSAAPTVDPAPVRAHYSDSVTSNFNARITGRIGTARSATSRFGRAGG